MRFVNEFEKGENAEYQQGHLNDALNLVVLIVPHRFDELNILNFNHASFVPKFDFDYYHLRPSRLLNTDQIYLRAHPFSTTDSSLALLLNVYDFCPLRKLSCPMLQTILPIHAEVIERLILIGVYPI